MGSIFAEGRQAARGGMHSWGSNVDVNNNDTKDGGHIVLGGSEPKFSVKLLDASDAPEPGKKVKESPVQKVRSKTLLSESFALKIRAQWRGVLANIDGYSATVRKLHTAPKEDKASVTKIRGKACINDTIGIHEEPTKQAGRNFTKLDIACDGKFTDPDRFVESILNWCVA